MNAKVLRSCLTSLVGTCFHLKVISHYEGKRKEEEIGVPGENPRRPSETIARSELGPLDLCSRDKRVFEPPTPPTATCCCASILSYNSFRISSVKTNNLIIDYFRMLSHRIWHKLFAQTAMDLGIALCLIYPYPYPSLHSYLQIPRD